MSATTLARKNTMWYINALITLAVMVLFRFLPATQSNHPIRYGRWWASLSV